MNDKNLQFYEAIGLDPFKELSVVGGFSSFKDLELINPYISSSDTIIELGAGFGRCLDYFISKKHKGKLTGIEFSEPLVAHLHERFLGKAEIVQADIKKLDIQESYNVALWMWSGIVDFSPEEQLDCCKRIFKLLYKGGKLFVDIPRLGVQTIADHIDQQHLHLKTTYGEIHAFIPNDKDMETIQKSVGFERMIKIDYSTATDKKRTVYMLQK